MDKIAILMAVYHPNQDWLRQQLKSLENQTYQNLELMIADDGPDMPVGESIFSECLHKIPFSYTIHPENMGTSRTYAELLGKATGTYVAFCDQDDQWYPEKLARLCGEMKCADVTAAYCGLCVIDGDGRKTADDVRQIRNRDLFLSGDGLAPRLFIKNSIYGCTLLVRTDVAKAALPLPDGMGFDHWFSLWAAIYGKLVFIDEPLIEYRIHGENQSKPLRGILTKQDYETTRIITLKRRSAECLKRFQQLESSVIDREALCHVALDAYNWAVARSKWLHHHWSAFPAFYAGRHLSPLAFRFELCIPFLPQKVFHFCVSRMGK